LDITLRDCGLNSFVIVGVALEIGIEPTVKHSTDLGYIHIAVTDACGGRDAAAMERTQVRLQFTGDALLTGSAVICGLFRWSQP
jgi:nicotinamidase-related amidase